MFYISLDSNLVFYYYCKKLFLLCCFRLDAALWVMVKASPSCHDVFARAMVVVTSFRVDFFIGLCVHHPFTSPPIPNQAYLLKVN